MFHGVIQKITLAQFFWDTVYIINQIPVTLVYTGWSTNKLPDFITSPIDFQSSFPDSWQTQHSAVNLRSKFQTHFGRVALHQLVNIVAYIRKLVKIFHKVWRSVCGVARSSMTALFINSLRTKFSSKIILKKNRSSIKFDKCMIKIITLLWNILYDSFTSYCNRNYNHRLLYSL